MGTSDFAGKLPSHLAPAGTPVQVPAMRGGSDAPNRTLKEQNADVMEWLRMMQEARPRPTAPAPPPRPALPTPAESEKQLAVARAALAKAIQLRDAAQRMVDDAGNALTRGRASADSIRESIREMGDIDHMISLWHADRIAKNKQTDPLPSDLQRRRDERTRLMQEASDADRAVDVLTAGHEAARARLKETQEGVTACVRKVLTCHCERLASRMVQGQHEAFALKRQLLALVDGGFLRDGPLPAPGAVMSALRAESEYWPAIPPTEGIALRRAWKALADALMLNPDCDLGEMP